MITDVSLYDEISQVVKSSFAVIGITAKGWESRCTVMISANLKQPSVFGHHHVSKKMSLVCNTSVGMFMLSWPKCALWDPINHRITKLKDIPMNVNIHEQRAVSIGEKVYIIADQSLTEKTFLLSLDLVTSQWSICAEIETSLQVIRPSLMLCSLDKSIYIFTGHDLKLKCYDTVIKTLSCKGHPPITSCKGLVAVTIETDLYLLGGYLGEYLRYSTTEDKWEKRQQMEKRDSF